MTISVKVSNSFKALVTFFGGMAVAVVTTLSIHYNLFL
jgi:uncharacterized membrane protein SpoIIM required for sporulation